jgi:hypothetical protein
LTVVHLQSEISAARRVKQADAGHKLPVGICILSWVVVSALLWCGIITAL